MPIFEYTCIECAKHFEAIVFGDKTPTCPSCNSDKLEKALSVFAVSTTGGKKSLPQAVGPCGTCGDPRGPGSCSFN